VSLRWRLTAALWLVVAVVVVGGTAAHLADVSRRLEQQLLQQAERVVSSIETDMGQTGELLDEEVRLALDPRGFLARGVGSSRVQSRYFVARARLMSGRLEILKLLGDDGEILTSGHWPASFGALDPQVKTYRTDPGASARIVDEATPGGHAPSLQRWARARWAGKEVTVVAGRFLDGDALERMRARVGADLLALCRPSDEGARCLTVRDRTLLPDDPFDPAAAPWPERLVLSRVPLGAGEAPPVLIAGLDRQAIDRVEQGMVRRAVLIGGLSIAFAVLLGFFLATREVRPIEAIGLAAGRLAGGDLATRVEEVGGGGSEMRGLVEAFNRMAADIERSQNKLKQAERVAAWREIARGLAHELKNPLTPILGAMDILRRARRLERPDFDDILNEQAEAVVEEVMRLKELADAFSRFARLPEPKLEPLPMDQVVDHALALYAAEGERLVVNRQYDEDLPPVVADRMQLATAITNLVKNAVEAMEGAGRLTLTLRARPASAAFERAHVEIVVEDSGPGISSEVQDRLFMPYVTTKGSRGTGLGLALVHRIVMEHEGAIEVGQAADGGAAFLLRLPLEGPRQVREKNVEVI
jgi:two-component system, NtrC family, nitrogen regulation sensor histidine kinase NtrY